MPHTPGIVTSKLHDKISINKFFATRMEFLGYVRNHNGMEPGLSKVNAVTTWFVPKNAKDI